MRSFQQIIVAFFALLVCAFAQQSSQAEVYDATVYVTSTVYRVNTVTMSGSPTGSVANSTSTYAASHPVGTPAYPSNGTVVVPTGSQTMPAPSQFTGAASALNANAFVAAFVAGVGYLVL